MDDDSIASKCPQIVTMLAVQVVSQVINDAQTVVQAIHGSGEPLIYTSLSKKIRNGERFGREIVEFTASVSERSETDDDHIEIVIATSTPQKESDRAPKVQNHDDVSESIVSGIGGGGDRTRSVVLTKSTSSFINDDFDLKEVEHVVTGSCHNQRPVYDSDNSVSKNHDAEIISETMESFLNKDLNTILPRNSKVLESEVLDEIRNLSSQDSSYSSYSLLLDIEVLNNFKEAFPENHEARNTNYSNNFHFSNNEAVNSEHNEQNGFTLYENTFLTLNRDEHNSEDGGQAFDDVISASLQEVDLLTVQVSQDDVNYKKKEIKEESHTGSRSKRSVMKQWRKNGVRLLAFLRNFWRRKSLKSKISSSVPEQLGFRALSPDGGRLASSLQQNRSPTPSPMRRCIRKFSTLNEATLFSQRWRKYSSKYNLEEDAGVFEQ